MYIKLKTIAYLTFISFKKSGKTLFFFFNIIALILIASSCSSQPRPASEKQVEKLLRYTVNEMNKKMPIMADSITKLNNLLYLVPHTIQYNYSLVNIHRLMLQLNWYHTLNQDLLMGIKQILLYRHLRKIKLSYNIPIVIV